MKGYRILVAEDDIDIVGILKLYLQNEGYEVLSASNGVDALKLISEEKIDLCLCDIMMPKMNGYELIQNIRKEYNMPIIIISAKRTDSDRIIGLDIGADDYIVKPFNPLELVARVRSALRRFYKLNPSLSEKDSGILVCGNLKVDQNTLTCYKNDKELLVTPTELKILTLLMKNPGRVYTKVQIYEHLNGEFFISDENTLMVHMSNLRNKIEDDPKKPRYIITVRGLGYKMGEVS